MNLLLDTCTFLWLLTADERLPEEILAAVREPNNRVWLSVVSTWEMSLKYHSGRLPLPADPAVFVPQFRELHDVLSLSLAEAAISHLSKLPPIHRDPFDRMLICQAIQDGLVIVTPDSAIHAYPIKSLWRT